MQSILVLRCSFGASTWPSRRRLNDACLSEITPSMCSRQLLRATVLAPSRQTHLDGRHTWAAFQNREVRDRRPPSCSAEQPAPPCRGQSASTRGPPVPGQNTMIDPKCTGQISWATGLSMRTFTKGAREGTPEEKLKTEVLSATPCGCLLDRDAGLLEQIAERRFDRGAALNRLRISFLGDSLNCTASKRM